MKGVFCKNFLVYYVKQYFITLFKNDALVKHFIVYFKFVYLNFM